jgi:hypothetical protein
MLKVIITLVLVFLICFITLLVFIIINHSILTFFPKDHFLKVWWEKHICSKDDLGYFED